MEYEQIRGADPPQYKFKWGQRARLEIPKINVLKFVCDVYGGAEVCKPEDWLSQYQEACKKDLFNEGIDPNATEDTENIEVRTTASQRPTRVAEATQQSTTLVASSNGTQMQLKSTRLRQRNA